MRKLGATFRDVAILVLVASAACSEGQTARPDGPQVASTCDRAYPAGPYGTERGETLADLSFDVLDERGESTRFALHEVQASCGETARVLLLRVHAGFCGTCRWQAAHLVESLGESLAERVRVLDVLVRDDDGDPPTLADRRLWRTRQDRPALVALDSSLRFVKPRAALPRVLVVDPRTMKIVDALDDPQPTALANTVAAAIATVDARPAPTPIAEARVDGLFSRQQYEMLRDMRLFSGPPPRDPTNRFGDDEVAAELGRQLFDDKLLSPSGLVSCERCHEKGRTFQDSAETATGGVQGADRNTPAIVLSAWSRWQFWDGRADTLWMQALMPIEDSREMASSRLFVVHRVQDAYKELYERIFEPLPSFDDPKRFAPAGKPGDPVWEAMSVADRDAVTGVYVNLGKALAAFERSFRATELPFEMYLRGTKDALTPLQKDGVVAFFEGGCAQCHWGSRLTDDAFHVLRFPTGRDDLEPDHGRIDGYAKYDASDFRADGRWSDAKQDRRKPANDAQLGGFKTPPLRGAAVTAPYGHGGSVPSLTMAIDLHRTAGMPAGSRYTTGVTEPWLVDFPPEKIDAIVAFLGTMGLGFVR